MPRDYDKPMVGQKGALAFIRRFVADNKRMPTAIEIATQFGWHESSARDCLMSLRCNGHLRSTRTPSGRGWRYTYELVT